MPAVRLSGKKLKRSAWIPGLFANGLSFWLTIPKELS